MRPDACLPPEVRVFTQEQIEQEAAQWLEP